MWGYQALFPLLISLLHLPHLEGWVSASRLDTEVQLPGCFGDAGGRDGQGMATTSIMA